MMISVQPVFSDTDAVGLKNEIDAIIKNKKARFGIGVLDIDNNIRFFINGDKAFPMMSVVKLPQAIVALKMTEDGRQFLNPMIEFKKEDLRKDTYSPLLKDQKAVPFTISLEKALSYSVSRSDNNVCDKLFQLIGGTNRIERYFRNLGYQSFRIGTDYRHMKKNGINANRISPIDMISILEKLHKGQLLSRENTALLWKKMIESETGPDRIRGKLPRNIQVGHKTGSSGTDKNGVTAAFNDVGIVKMPNGKSFAIVVFISDSRESAKTNAETIAKITEISYQYLNH